MNPCVKFYKNITEWKWFSVPEMVQLIMYFVCKADHEPFLIGDELIAKGQVVIRRKDVCAELNMKEQTFRTCMKRLIADGKIVTVSDKFRSTVVTVSNFSRYIDDAPSPQIAEPKKEEPKKELKEQPTTEQLQQPDTQTPPTQPRSEQPPTSLFPEELPEEPAPITTTKTKKKEVDCDFILKLYHDRCPSLPKVLKLNDKRKVKVRIRFEEMHYNYETLQEVFDRCEASHFIRGDNARGWRADFDWIFTNSQNWVKVLEGKYDNRDNPYATHGTAPNTTTPAGQFATQSARNAANSTRQKCDILNTLAKCQQDYDAGNLPTLVGVEENL